MLPRPGFLGITTNPRVLLGPLRETQQPQATPPGLLGCPTLGCPTQGCPPGERRTNSKLLASHLTGLILQAKSSNLIFFFSLYICKSQTVLGKKKKIQERNLEGFRAARIVCNGERFETNKTQICPVWIIFSFTLLPVYRFLYS